MGNLHVKTERYDIEIFNDHTFTLGSADNVRAYSREYVLTDEWIATQYGIRGGLAGGQQESCVLLAGGWGSTVHERSAVVVDHSLFVAVGNVLCSVRLPSLELEWHCQVDWGACFGVYYLPADQCLCTHGEQEISRVSLMGEIEWNASGKDVFTGEFCLFPDHIEVVDFNGERYRIELESGRIALAGREHCE